MNKEKLESLLHEMETYDLARVIEDDYYRIMIGCPKEEANQRILDLIDDVLIVETFCASPDIERYDLAIICRDKRVKLADNIILNGV